MSFFSWKNWSANDVAYNVHHCCLVTIVVTVRCVSPWRRKSMPSKNVQAKWKINYETFAHTLWISVVFKCTGKYEREREDETVWMPFAEWHQLGSHIQFRSLFELVDHFVCCIARRMTILIKFQSKRIMLWNFFPLSKRSRDSVIVLIDVHLHGKNALNAIKCAEVPGLNENKSECFYCVPRFMQCK